jgi:putative ATP-binding cassette transporter
MPLVTLLLRRSRPIVASSLAAGLISGVATSFLIGLIHETMQRTGSIEITILASFAGLCLLLPVSRIVSQTLLIRLAQQSVRELRADLSKRVAATPLRTLEQIGSHRVMATLTDDVTAISAGLTALPVLFIQMVVIVACLAYLATMSVWLSLSVAVLLGLGMWSVQLAVGVAMVRLGKARRDQDQLFKHMRALTDGAKELKLHAERRRMFFAQVLHETARSCEQHNVAGNVVFAAAMSWATLVFFVQIGLLLFLVPQLALVSQDALNGATLTLLYALVPLEVIGSVMPALGRANVALANIRSLGLTLPERVTEAESSDSKTLMPFGTIELDRVTHTYRNEADNSEFTLGPLDLTLRPGELVFVVGGNGSGKTTLAKVIAGLYVPARGEVRLDGRAITDATRDEYRQHFSAVFSDFYLFDRLLGFQADGLDARATSLLSALQLQHKVSVTGGKLSTIDLSQGQRKRLALLTASLEQRPVYIFDEWAADQDVTFKDVFYRTLLPDLKASGRTVIVISHDDRYYSLADRIVKLDAGQIEFDSAVAKANTARLTRGVTP